MGEGYGDMTAFGSFAWNTADQYRTAFVAQGIVNSPVSIYFQLRGSAICILDQD